MSNLDQSNIDQVLLSTVRRTMPNIIANDIIGVQPMLSRDYMWQTIYEKGSILMKKVHYQHFVRLPNRKKYGKLSEIVEKYKYPCVKISGSKYKEAKLWCEQNLKPGSYIQLNTHFVFAYEQDASWFGLVLI